MDEAEVNRHLEVLVNLTNQEPQHAIKAEVPAGH